MPRDLNYLGIDPGVQGGWGIINQAGKLVACGPSADFFKTIIPAPRPWGKGVIFPREIAHACLEKIQVWDSDTKAHLFRLQKLLADYGRWQGRLETLAIPFTIVPSPTWKANFGLRGKKGVWKGEVLALARSLWPEAPLGLKKHEGLAVGLLLAEYGRQHFLGVKCDAAYPA